ncbi:MAG TPA: hypothetical protein DCR93_24430 [Cytophagales bacterium]|nr:hypothetical protein [Cytophagales bacterium]
MAVTLFGYGCQTIVIKEDFSSNLPFDSLFSGPTAVRTLEETDLVEISGMVASRQYPGYLWAHNDSGDEPRLICLDSLGNWVATHLVEGIELRDWEDITIGLGSDSAWYLYVGEIGDNEAVHDQLYIYQIAEPSPFQSGSVTVAGTMSFVYPDGAREAETLMYDPVNDELWVVSKREERVGIYQLGTFSSTQVTPQKATFTLPFSNVVAGDISPSGEEILIKKYDTVFYWTREPEQSILDVLQATPKRLVYVPEPQGESIAWKADELGYFTLSERRNNVTPVLYYYSRIDE